MIIYIYIFVRYIPKCTQVPKYNAPLIHYLYAVIACQCLESSFKCLLPIILARVLCIYRLFFISKQYYMLSGLTFIKCYIEFSQNLATTIIIMAVTQLQILVLIMLMFTFLSIFSLSAVHKLRGIVSQTKRSGQSIFTMEDTCKSQCSVCVFLNFTHVYAKQGSEGGSRNPSPFVDVGTRH